ncbi:MAG: SDR family NAD(P)-dependent oxidoreductase [Caldicoprobacterales bacterium]|jgi:short-subunit dehydrogenase|nr:SDR family NAD(P)-dependent oxidoreductase [Clostridiales bacterium]
MNVMITGAAGGLGRALANECGSRGFNLFLTDVNEDGLLSIKLGLERQFNVTVTTKSCDLTNAESVDKMLAIIDKYGIRFDMLLNIAGLDFEGEFIGRDREKLVKIVMLNNAATLRITHAIIKRRRPGKHFTIVFVSSLASMFPMPLKATYAASKRFLLDFAASLRQELKKEDVNVLALCPGGMVTTQETLCSIKAQGFWGNVTTNPLEDVARNTIDRALAGRSIYVPGIPNRLLSFFGKIMPRSWVAAVVYWRWNNAQSKWLNHN